MKSNKRQFQAALLIILAALVIAVFASEIAQAQEVPPQVTINEGTCGQFSALVTNVEPGDMIRFQLGHDLVKNVEVSEQDTPTPFQSGAFPAGDWGFSVRVDDKVIYDKAVTVKACPGGGDTLEVQSFDCNQVTVWGTGWEQTEATVEIAIPPSEGGESRDDLLMIEQVQPNSEGIITTTLEWPEPPRDGRYAAVVLIDNIQRDPQSEGFELKGCQAKELLPFTGPTHFSIVLVLLAIALILGGAAMLILIAVKPKEGK